MNFCDHDHPTKEETRFLPIGGEARIIVCKRHWAHELKHRRLIGVVEPQYLPAWETLAVNEPAVDSGS